MFTELTTILFGVIASLIAIEIVQGCVFLKRVFNKRKLKKVLSIHGHSCNIIASIYLKKLEFGSIHYTDAYAFGHLFELCHRLNIESKLIPFHKIPETAEPEDIISIGGPVSNEITERYLKDYCIGFSLIYEGKNESQNPNVVDTNTKYVTGFKCGGQVLQINDNEEYGILVKLTKKELNKKRTVHLIFGYSGIGTGAAAYFLWKNYEELYHKFKDKKYCVAIKVSRREGYKSIYSTYIDLTSAAFNKSM